MIEPPSHIVLTSTHLKVTDYLLLTAIKFDFG
jgi:hypothetical protein